MTTSKERTYQIIIGCLILVILVGGWFAFGRTSVGNSSATEGMSATSTQQEAGAEAMQGGSNAPASSTGMPSGSTVASSGNDSVSVANQPAGTEVSVQSVSLGQLGWVAVRDSSGRTLGAGLFPAGTHTDVSVSLLRATEAGQQYQVLLYSDDGDKAFDLHKDSLITNADGSVAGTTFTAN